MGVQDAPIDDLKTVEEMMEFLQGETPEGFRLANQPELDEDNAFTVIYVLQEKFELITDNFDRCENCGSVFNQHYGGHVVEPADDKHGREEIYNDLDDIPDFGGIFCSNGCLNAEAREHRKARKDNGGESQ